MLGQLLLLGFIFSLVPLYDSAPLESIYPRTDEFGVEWVGPIRKCPYEEDHVLNACTNQITRELTPLVGAGIKELGLQPLDPILIKKLGYDLDLGPIKVNIMAKNMKIHDLPKYKVLKWKVDTNKRIMRFVYEIPKFRLDSDYKLGGNVFFFPLKGSGPVHLEIYGLRAEGHMNFYKTENENGEKVIQLKETVMDQISIKDMDLRIRGFFDGNPLFTALAHYFGNRYGPEIFEVGKQDITKEVNEVITNTLLNPILRRLPYIADYVPDN